MSITAVLFTPTSPAQLTPYRVHKLAGEQFSIGVDTTLIAPDGETVTGVEGTEEFPDSDSAVSLLLGYQILPNADGDDLVAGVLVAGGYSGQRSVFTLLAEFSNGDKRQFRIFVDVDDNA